MAGRHEENALEFKTIHDIQEEEKEAQDRPRA